MRVVYVAGPFRAANAWEVEQNIRRAEGAALEVWRLGAACICPHTNTRFFDGAADDRVWLDGDMEILTRCDAVLPIQGWETSTGARTEHDLAVSMHIPVFTALDDLHRWLTNGVLFE